MTSSTAAGALTLLTLLPLARGAGLLLPQESESREVKSLDGLWSFKPDPGDGAARGWAKAGLPSDHTMMPVPASYNDLTQDQSLRDLVGVVWYERTVFVPLHWATQRVVLYVGSANHHARVWLNGVLVGEHEGGHLPFHLPLDPTLVAFGRASRLTIAVNNTLHATTIPPGWVQTNVAGRRVQRLQMDFFNYAGIQRQVLLYTTLLGGIGALLPFTSRQDLEFCQALEMHLRQEAPPLCGRDHLFFRSAFFPVKGVVDGDFCQTYLRLSPDEQRQVAEELDRTPAEVAKKLEELASRIL